MTTTASTSLNVIATDRIEQILDHLQRHRDPAQIPADALAAARTFLMDSVGVALAGTSVRESQQVLRAARLWNASSEAGSHGDALVWGTATWLPAPSAAMVNAFHIHNQEFDCVHAPAVVHPMAVILAAVVAAAERAQRVSGTRLLAALALAVDTATVIGMSATKPIRFFRPAQCGCIGATAGIAWLLGCDRETTRNAIGLAYSQLAGTMQAHIEGTPALAMQIGFAARAAICAVDLAREGFRGPHQVLDGKHGYFALFEPDAAPDAAFAKLGHEWQITRVSHKPFPTGRAAHGGIAGCQVLMRDHGFGANDVAEVVLAAPPLIRQLVDRPMLTGATPMNTSYARLCLPYLLAVTLVHGSVTLDAYQPSWLSDEALSAVAARVRVIADDNLNANALAPQHLRIRLHDGRVFERALPVVYGAPEWPMTLAAQREKFTDCCLHAAVSIDAKRAQSLMTAIDEIAAFDDVRALFAITAAHAMNISHD